MLTRFLVIVVSMFALTGCTRNVSKEFKPVGPVTQFSNDDYSRVLEAVVTEDGFVDHDRIARNEDDLRDSLHRYVALIGEVSPLNRPELFPTREDQLAYWINAYNALCLFAVQERGLPSNVLYSGTVGSIFFIDTFDVGDKRMTLNTIEKTYVRSFNDARIHFALNCMSASCPPLLDVPYEGSQLEQQLKTQTDLSLVDPRIVQMKDSTTARLNKIITDYWDDDFIDHARAALNRRDVTVLDAVKSMAPADAPVQQARDFESMDYDWSLNRPRG